jgi:hypothetical protein
MRHAVILWAMLLWTTGCGYHVAGKTDQIPATIKTIAIPAFSNNTIRFKLARELPTDITREFNSRTRYKVVTDPSGADAILTGSLVNFISYPIITDQATGRATAVQASAFIKITLTERATGKVLFARPLFEVRERYEISENPGTYFDESGAGMARLSKDVAHDVVTSILENF